MVPSLVAITGSTHYPHAACNIDLLKRDPALTGDAVAELPLASRAHLTVFVSKLSRRWCFAIAPGQPLEGASADNKERARTKGSERTQKRQGTAVVSKRKSALACSRAMQRRGINKWLSFAEAENGQKDRNKEVEEEREAATEKGINKLARESERTGKSRRPEPVATAEAEAAPSTSINSSGSSTSSSGTATTSNRSTVQSVAAWPTNVPDLLLLRCTTVLALKTFHSVLPPLRTRQVYFCLVIRKASSFLTAMRPSKRRRSLRGCLKCILKDKWFCRGRNGTGITFNDLRNVNECIRGVNEIDRRKKETTTA